MHAIKDKLTGATDGWFHLYVYLCVCHEQEYMRSYMRSEIIKLIFG